MTDERTASEPEVPYPPRYWWLKRLLLAGAVLLGCLLGVRLWWGREMGRLLAAEHARVRAAGEPASVADLGRPPVPAARNAATFIGRAMAVQRAGLGPSESNFTFPAYPPFPRRWHRLADAAVAKNAAVFPLLRRARAHDEADWGTPIGSPMYAVLLPTLGPTRGLANLAADAAMREHVRGDDAAAVELLRDVLHLARAVDGQPFLVSHLVAVGCEALALERIQVMAPGLRVAAGEDIPVGNPVPGGPATRGQVKALIAELLGGAPRRRAAVARALATERVAQADAVRWATQGNAVLRPLFDAEERRVFASTAWYTAAAGQQTWGGVRAVLASRPPPPAPGGGGPSRAGTRLAAVIGPSLDRAFQIEIGSEAERRLTAVSLAAQLYRADHARWPASLDELVPAYLPAVPVDPYAPAGEPLRYLLARGALPSGEDRPVVYAVGENQSDDTAAGLVPLPAEPLYGSLRGEVDRWRDLARWQPPAPPAAATQPPSGTEDGGDGTGDGQGEGEEEEQPEGEEVDEGEGGGNGAPNEIEGTGEDAPASLE